MLKCLTIYSKIIGHYPNHSSPILLHHAREQHHRLWQYLCFPWTPHFWMGIWTSPTSLWAPCHGSRVNDELNNLKSNISQFRHFSNQSISNDQFSKMLINHVTSYNLSFHLDFLCLPLLSHPGFYRLCLPHLSWAMSMTPSPSPQCWVHHPRVGYHLCQRCRGRGQDLLHCQQRPCLPFSSPCCPDFLQH